MIMIELPDEQASTLRAQAQARGLTLGQWILQLAGHAPPPVSAEGGEQGERPVWEIIADN